MAKNVASIIITDTPDGTLGAHSFEYTISDGNGGGDTATVTVTVIDPAQDILPIVTLIEPTDGSTIGGKRVKLRANASDDNGVTQVEFHLDDAWIGTDSDGSDGWLFRWNSRESPNGPDQLLTATARDTTGQETTSATVSVTIDNGGGDTGDPSTVNCKKKQNRNLPACNGG